MVSSTLPPAGRTAATSPPHPRRHPPAEPPPATRTRAAARAARRPAVRPAPVGGAPPSRFRQHGARRSSHRRATAAAAGRRPPRLGPSAPAWLLGAAPRHPPPTADAQAGGGQATPQPAPGAPPSLTVPVQRASSTRPTTVWATERAHGGVPSETVGAIQRRKKKRKPCPYYRGRRRHAALYTVPLPMPAPLPPPSVPSFTPTVRTLRPAHQTLRSLAPMRLLIVWFPDRRPPRHGARHRVLTTARPAKKAAARPNRVVPRLVHAHRRALPFLSTPQRLSLNVVSTPKGSCRPKKSLVSASKQGCSSWLLDRVPRLSHRRGHHRLRSSLSDAAAAATSPHPPGKTTKKKNLEGGGARGRSAMTRPLTSARPPPMVGSPTGG